MKYKNIIIGYGASGLYLAKHINDKNTLVIEKNSEAGVKLKLTGNGYCNFTNLKDNSDFLLYINNSKFFYGAISRYNTNDILKFFKEQGLALNYREDNRMFTKNGSDELIDVLSDNECEVLYNTSVTEVTSNTVTTENKTFEADNIIIATGGSSYKFTGSDGYIYKFAKNNDLKTVNPYSVEGKLIYKKTSILAGISIDNVTISYKKKSTNGTFLFTHTGFSGSSCLKICEHLKPNSTITIDFLPERSEDTIKQNINNCNKELELHTFLSGYFTKSFGSYIVSELGLQTNIKIKNLNTVDVDNIINYIKHKEFSNVNPVTLDKAIITGGGLSLKEINPKNFSLKKFPNTYVIGEALDIHGQIGGYNLSLAFIEAYIVYLNLK